MPGAGFGAERLPLDQPEGDDEVDDGDEQEQPDDDELERRGTPLRGRREVQSSDSSGACALTSIVAARRGGRRAEMGSGP